MKKEISLNLEVADDTNLPALEMIASEQYDYKRNPGAQSSGYARILDLYNYICA